MSKGNKRRTPKAVGRYPSDHSGAMEEAFKAAMAAQGGTPENEASGATKENEQKQARTAKPKARSDEQLLKEAYDGVTPLKKDAYPYQAEARRKRREKRRVRGAKVRATLPANVYIDSDGKRKLRISGDGFLEWGKPKKVKSLNAKAQPTTELIIDRDVSINEDALKDDREHFCSAVLHAVEGEGFQEDAQDEIELVIGLDFGTAYCKVVVQEPGSGKAWAVPLSGKAANPYILATKVWRKEEAFNLAEDGSLAGNLKVPLLMRDMPGGHAVAVVAFLALVIRYVKAWITANKADEFAGVTPLWFVNMGLPARNLDDREMVKTFTKLLWAAMLLAELPGRNVEVRGIERALANVQRAWKSENNVVSGPTGKVVHADQIGIYPEIGAQIYGYPKSDLWDRTLTTFMLVDVGGGTVDGSIFRVKELRSGETQFIFISSAVEKLGVYVLHRHRLKWHISQLTGKDKGRNIEAKFRRMLTKNVMPAAVPDDIEDYLVGAEYPEETSDKEFYRRFGRLLWDEIVLGVRAITGHSEGTWRELPFLLCGGGRSIGLYKRFIRFINDPRSGTSLRLREISMEKPKSLEGDGIGNSVYQRLSVAYGLSFPDIGEVITRDMLPKTPPESPRPTFTDSYIAKEMT